jgi:hypothetical protein
MAVEETMPINKKDLVGISKMLIPSVNQVHAFLKVLETGTDEETAAAFNNLSAPALALVEYSVPPYILEQWRKDFQVKIHVWIAVEEVTVKTEVYWTTEIISGKKVKVMHVPPGVSIQIENLDGALETITAPADGLVMLDSEVVEEMEAVKNAMEAEEEPS